jgi:hypothetical protein
MRYAELPKRSPETDQFRHLWFERQNLGMSLRGFTAMKEGRLPLTMAARKLGISEAELERTRRPCEHHHINNRMVPFFDCTDIA